jgi:hypothetical protein
MRLLGALRYTFGKTFQYAEHYCIRKPETLWSWTCRILQTLLYRPAVRSYRNLYCTGLQFSRIATFIVQAWRSVISQPLLYRPAVLSYRNLYCTGLQSCHIATFTVQACSSVISQPLMYRPAVLSYRSLYCTGVQFCHIAAFTVQACSSFIWNSWSEIVWEMYGRRDNIKWILKKRRVYAWLELDLDMVQWWVRTWWLKLGTHKGFSDQMRN